MNRPSPVVYPSDAEHRATTTRRWRPALTDGAGRLSLATLIIFALVVSFLPLQSAPLVQAQSGSTAKLILEASASKSTVEAGEVFSFYYAYSCAGITGSCDHVKITTDPFPESLTTGTLEFISADIEGDDNIKNFTYNTGTRVAMWEFIDSIPTGTTSVVKINVRVKNDGHCPDGTTISLPATMTADGLTPADDTGSVTVRSLDSGGSSGPSVPYDKFSVSKTSPKGSFVATDETTGADVDIDVPYTVSVCNTGDSGLLPMSSMTLTDTLPAPPTSAHTATLVSVTTLDDGTVAFCDGVPCSTPPPPNTSVITWVGFDLPVNTCRQATVTLRYPTTDFDLGDTVQNDVDASGLGEDKDPDAYSTASGYAQNTLVPGIPIGTVSKSTTVHDRMNIGGTFTYWIDAANHYDTEETGGNVLLHDFVVNDVVPDQVEVQSIRVASGQEPATIEYQTSDDPGNWHATATTTGTILVSSLSLAPGDYITHLRWTYGDVDIATSTRVGYDATVLATDHSSNPVSVGDTFPNNAELSYRYGPTPYTKQAHVDLEVIQDQPRPELLKGVNKGEIAAGSYVTYTLSLSNEFLTTVALTQPMLADLLPTALDYDTWSGWSIQSKPAGAPDPLFDIEYNYNGTGRTLLRWRWNGASAYDLPPGEKIELIFWARVKKGTNAGQIVNEAALISEGVTQPSKGMDNCPFKKADNHDLDGDSNTGEQHCVSNNGITTVKSIARMKSILWVQGQKDATWSKHPDFGHTVPGGAADYRLDIWNDGTVPVQNLVVIDILPFIGDTAVTALDERLTEWRPQLIAPINVPPGVTVEYSTEGYPCRSEMTVGSAIVPPDCVTANWSTTPPADITQVQSFRLNFGSMQLNAQDHVLISWQMRAPPGTPEGIYTWDSFAYVADPIDTSLKLLPSEPNKVGIIIDYVTKAGYGNYVWIDTDKDGLQDATETGLNGVQVDLYQPGPDGVADTGDDVLVGTTYTTDDFYGNPGYYLFNDLEPGSYFAKFTPPPAYSITGRNMGDDTLDSDVYQVSGLTPITTLDSGEQDLTWDMGLYEENAAVGNYVWYDRNGNGTQDESPIDGINGVTVQLFQGATLVGTTVTANDAYGNPGYYLFDDLTPGSNYQVRFTLPSGATFTSSTASGTSDPSDSDANTVTGATNTFTLSDGEYDDTWDAGLILTEGVLTLGNRVWFETDDDGIYEPQNGEQGIDNVLLNLYKDDGTTSGTLDSGDTFVRSTVSATSFGEAGYYAFTDLLPGDYIVQVDPSNFVGGGALRHYVSTSPDNLTPNDDDDDDDNGYEESDYVVSKFITLAMSGTPGVGAEPTNDRDSDPNTNMSLDFGFIPLSSLGNYVWADRNKDGIQNEPASEGLNGIPVELYDAGTGTLIATTTTADDSSGNPGSYLFEDLKQRNYYVTFDISSLPAGTVFTTKDAPASTDTTDSDVNPSGVNEGQTDTITLGIGEHDMTWDAGVQIAEGLLNLGNRVWWDQNNSGTHQTATEPGIANVRVNLYMDNGATPNVFDPPGVGQDTMIAITYTNSAGYYTFTKLLSDTYIVQIDTSNFVSGGPLSGFSNSTGNDIAGTAPDPDGTAPILADEDEDDNGYVPGGYGIVSYGIDLWDDGSEPDTDTSANDSNWRVDFGFYKGAKLGNFAWVERKDAGGNANGIQDSNELGLGRDGVYVYLYDKTTDLLATPLPAITDQGGYYTFTNVVSGTYYLLFVPPPGYAITLKDQGGDSVDSDAYNDEAIPATWGRTDPFQIEWGDEDLTRDIGLVPVFSVGNRVWRETDNDARYETGETGVNGVLVHLYRDSNNNNTIDGGEGPISSTLTTDDSNGVPGYYLFSSDTSNHFLPEGNYLVQIDPSNFAPGGPLYHLASVTGVGPTYPNLNPLTQLDTDPDNNTDNDDNGYPMGTGSYPESSGVRAKSVTLNYDYTLNRHGEPDARYDTDWWGGNATVDFGFYPLAEIGNYVWWDQNHNGVQDAGEPGVPNISVELRNTGTAPNPVWTTTTNATGYYSFTHVIPNQNYRLTFTAPVSYVITLQNQGGNDNTDSDAARNNGRVTGITLSIGQSNMTVDTGLIGVVSLGNRVWNDSADNDGIFDTGEPVIPGVRVRLYEDTDNNGVYDGTEPEVTSDALGQPFGTVTTDGNGRYRFQRLYPTNIAISDYPYIVVVDPSNFASGGALYHFQSSTGFGYPPRVPNEPHLDPNANPDEHIDNDDTGYHISNAVASGAITMVFTGEPMSDDDFPGDPADNDQNTNYTIDFGFFQLASIGNRVWIDTDRMGDQDAGEATGLANVRVNLYYDFDLNGTIDVTTEFSTTTTTNASGNYIIEALWPGDYLVEFVRPGGYRISPQGPAGSSDPTDSDADLTTGLAEKTTLGAGEYDDTWDMGVYPIVSIGNYVWEDINDNGVQNIGEASIPGVKVNLYDGTGTALINTTMTDATGHYTFTHTSGGAYLAPGNYIVEIDESNFQHGKPLYHYASSTLPNPVPDPDVNTSNTDDNGQNRVIGHGVRSLVTTLNNTGQPLNDEDTTIDDPSSNYTVDFGFFPLSSIGDRVWIDDEDWDGVQDAGEPGLPGIEVTLYDGSGNFVASTTSTITGFYQFEDLLYGNYSLRFTEPVSYRLTYRDQGVDTTDSDADRTPGANLGRTATTTLAIGEHDMTWDAGLFPIVSLGNRVWYDKDNDGVYEPGGDDGTDPGINGVTVELYWDTNDNGSLDATDLLSDTTTTVTDGSGNDGFYEFTELIPDVHKYIVVIPASEFAPGTGTLDTYRSSTGHGFPTYAPPSETDVSTDNDVDHDDNGRPENDPVTNGVHSVAVNLSFQNEPRPGTSNDDNDTGENDQNINYTIDFGFLRLMSLGDFVWYDKDNNGRYNPSAPYAETPISGVDLNLYRDLNQDGKYDAGDQIVTDAGGTPIVATTDASGIYTFTHLLPGHYIVMVRASNFAGGGALVGYYSSDGHEATVGNAPDPNNDVENDDNGNALVAGVGVPSKAITLADDGTEPDDDQNGVPTMANWSVDFGFYRYVSLGNLVWRDSDNNGTYDLSAPQSEVGIPSVTVHLYEDANNDNIPDGASIQTQTTGATGHYTFTNLRPYTYIVEVDTTSPALAGYYSSSDTVPAPDPDDDQDDDDNGDPTTGYGVLSKAVVLINTDEPDNVPGGDEDGTNGNTTVDFGFHRLVAVGNLVWYDRDNDGVYEPAATLPEAVIPGVTVQLYYDDGATPGVYNGDETPANDYLGNPVPDATTDSNGIYEFTDLLPGNYLVVIPASNFASTGELYRFASSGDTSPEPDPDNNVNNDDNGEPDGSGNVAAQAVTLWDRHEPDDVDHDATPDDNDANWTVDFGFYRMLSLGNRVWRDLNNNGKFEPSEPTYPEEGINGVTVQLYWDSDGSGTLTASDSLSRTTTTDVDGLGVSGHYTFTDLPPGDYIVVIPALNFASGAQLDGMVSSTGGETPAGNAPDPDASNDPDDDVDENGYPLSGDVVAEAVTLEDQNEPDDDPITSDVNLANWRVDFGFHRLLSLGDYVWRDVNNNGWFDAGEDAIPGVDVALYRDDGNNGYDTGDTFIADDTTDGFGLYHFTDLLPGYYVVVISDTNFLSSGALDGYRTSDGNDLDPDIYPGEAPDPDNDVNNDDNGQWFDSAQDMVVSKPVWLIDNTEPDTDLNGYTNTANWTVDFGFFRPLSLGNLVWRDSDNDGTYDPSPALQGEVGMPGVTLRLYEDTNNNGVYDQGTDKAARDVFGDPVSDQLTDITDATGHYTFTNLRPYTYFVQIEASNFTGGGELEDYYNSTGHESPVNTPPSADDDVNDDDNGAPQTYDAPNGVMSTWVRLIDDDEPVNDDDTDTNTNLAVDFGFHRLVAVGNLVWYDRDNDGQYDPTDPTLPEEGRPDVTVQLFEGDGTTQATDYEGNPVSATTTDASGHYTFTNLLPGDYVLVIPASNFASGGQLYRFASSGGMGTEPDPDDDVNDDDNGEQPVIDDDTVARPVTLWDRHEPDDANGTPPDDSDANWTVDFGFYRYLSLGNRVWRDSDNDGIFAGDPTYPEEGLNGVTVELYWDTNNNDIFEPGTDIYSRTTTTANDGTYDGYYAFEDLPPGDYIVVLTSTNFLPGAVLDGYIGSTARMYQFGTDLSVDPDNNNDPNDNEDENGDPVDSRGIVAAGAVTLIDRSEPDMDNYTNLWMANWRVDFGVFRPLSLGNIVWRDRDNDGSYEPNAADGYDEVGIGGVVLSLYHDTNDNNIYDIGVDTPVTHNAFGADRSLTTTDATGHYTFTNLLPGDYIVVVSDTNFLSGNPLYDMYSSWGHEPTIGNAPDPDSGYLPNTSDDDIDSDDNGNRQIAGVGVPSKAVSLRDATEPDDAASNPSPGNEDANWRVDFGFYPQMSLGNRVWHDKNNNAFQDDDEEGIANVIVNLYWDGDRDSSIDVMNTADFSATTTTDATGYYTFTDLVPSYYVVQIDQSNFESGGPLEGKASSDGGGDIAAITAEPQINPNNNDNTDDNGFPYNQIDGGVVSLPIQLVADSEPPADGNDDEDSDINSNLSLDFGFYILAGLGDTVWLDMNRNGVQDTGEFGVPGVEVTLYHQESGTISGTLRLTTDAGYYWFRNVLPGNYYLVFTPPPGYELTVRDQGKDTRDSDASIESGEIRIRIDNYGVGEINPTLDVGLVGIMSLGNHVWVDQNNNGVMDSGEPGIGNVKVNLYWDSNNDGKLTPGVDRYIINTTTDSSGNYLFEHLPPARYIVQIDQTSFAPGAPLYDYASSTGNNVDGVAPSPENDVDSDDNGEPYAAHGVPSFAVTLEAGTEPTDDGDGTMGNMTVDFGFYPLLSLGDLVWKDSNNSGTYEPASGETGINNVVVNLYQDSDANGSYTDRVDTLLASTTTASENGEAGHYAFNRLTAGDYVVVVDSGNFQRSKPLYLMINSTGNDVDGTAPDPDTDVNDDDNGYRLATGAVPAYAVTLNAGSEPTSDGDSSTTSNLSVDFGFYQTASVGDYVWDDTNRNGVQESWETGIPGVTVELYDNNGKLIATTTTDSTGHYIFTDLVPGDYSLRFVPPGGYTITDQDRGSDDAADSDADTATGRTDTFTLDVNEFDEWWDAGMVPVVPTGGLVPSIQVEKVVDLVRIVPNQVVRYTITVTNTSATVVLLPVQIIDSLPEGITFMPGTATPSEPSVNGQILTWADISDGAGLQPGESRVVTFQASVTAEVGTYTNEATAEGWYAGGSVTDSDDVSLAVHDPSVQVHKGYISPGFVDGRITFTIDITNTGPSTLEMLPLLDHFQGPIEYVGGSPRADLVDNGEQVIGWNDLTESFGDLAPGEAIHLETIFRLLPEAEEEGSSDILNVATVSGAVDRFGNSASDVSSAVSPPPPQGTTAIELLSFTATRAEQGIDVQWVTGAEINTWGFHLLRSTDGTRESAVRVTPEMIMAQGRSTSGATYTWLDTDVTEGVTYTYWLEETEIGGTLREYGPAELSVPLSADTSERIYMPLMVW